MARKKQATDVTSDPTSREISEATPSVSGGSAGNGEPARARIKKIDMVHQAMKEGGKRKPTEIRDWIKEKYDETITTNYVSALKSTLQKHGAKKARRIAAEEDSSARRNGSDSLTVDEIRIVKEFMERIGADKFRELVDLLS